MLDEPASKRDLLELEQRLERTIDQKFEEKFEEKFEQKFEEKFEQKFEQKFAMIRREFNLDLARAINAAFEMFGTRFGALDDKLEARTAGLRGELETHASDTSIHVRPPAPAPRKARRKPAR